MIIGLLVLCGLWYIICFICFAVFEVIKGLFNGISGLSGVYRSHAQNRYLRQQDIQRNNYIKQIEPRYWKSRAGLYFYNDNDVKAFHCHRRVIQFFTDDNKVITIPESDINNTYYLINMELTPANDVRYPGMKYSKLTFITTDKSKVVKVTPTLPRRSVVFLKAHFLLNDLEKKEHRINSLG